MASILTRLRVLFGKPARERGVMCRYIFYRPQRKQSPGAPLFRKQTAHSRIADERTDERQSNSERLGFSQCRALFHVSLNPLHSDTPPAVRYPAKKSRILIYLIRHTLIVRHCCFPSKQAHQRCRRSSRLCICTTFLRRLRISRAFLRRTILHTSTSPCSFRVIDL